MKKLKNSAVTLLALALGILLGKNASDLTISLSLSIPIALWISYLAFYEKKTDSATTHSQSTKTNLKEI